MNRIEVSNAHPVIRMGRRETEHVVRRVLQGERLRRAQIGVVFINDRRMIAMNKRFLQHHHTTDVLSFPLSEEGNPRIEGEVYVNLDQARRQAQEFGVRLRDESARLVIHGVLHLSGRKDTLPRQRKEMTRLEDHYLRSLNYRIGID